MVLNFKCLRRLTARGHLSFGQRCTNVLATVVGGDSIPDLIPVMTKTFHDNLLLRNARLILLEAVSVGRFLLRNQ